MLRLPTMTTGGCTLLDSAGFVHRRLRAAARSARCAPVIPILAQALEHGFAQQVAFRRRAVGDLASSTGSTQVAFAFLTGSDSGESLRIKGLEPLAQITCHRLGVAAAYLAGVELPFAFTPTHVQRGDPARLGAELLDEGQDIGLLATTDRVAWTRALEAHDESFRKPHRTTRRKAEGIRAPTRRENPIR
jgi:hypothetical protein